MGFRACDRLRTHDEFIGLGLLRKEHLYKGPRTGQEDGLLTQPSKYFSYLLSYKREFIYLYEYLIKKSGDCKRAQHRISALAILLGTRPESRSETS